MAGDASKINDEKSKAMIEEYASYANDASSATTRITPLPTLPMLFRRNSRNW